ncbi:Gfo/Idh/MocA family oxidoreductase [SAR116 cluster bacterium]|nr:Gfo/Idh/MocA family oxidoreductase [SAR116 cluster bacterium]
MTRIGLIGCGMWGRNLARNLSQLGVLASVADVDADRANAFATEFESAAQSVETLLADSTLAGVVLATAAPSHCDLAISALENGLHVYVEKPLALNLEDAQKMAAAAEQADKQIMVGHLIRYHDAFIELHRQVAAGAVGEVRHITANRLAMGRIRSVESVIFDLCPHDLSLVLALMDGEPQKITCNGACHITPGIVDVASTFLGFSGGRSATLNTSWITPYKEHRLTVTGSTGALVFDDGLGWDEKLTLYRDDIRPDAQSASQNTQIGHGFIINREKPQHLPLPESEPLKQEMRAFIECAETGRPPTTDIRDALAVQRVLETMNNNLNAFGVPA